MRGILRTLFLTTAAISAAVVLYFTFTLPPRARHLDVAPPPTVVTGAYHVHTRRSDGSGDADSIAAAAARAGLAFVILTDHGDATRTPDPPVYRHGVLCIDAVEINTAAGHLVALGLSGPAPYPLAGAARDVIADVHRLGGVAIAAHPDSPDEDLRWRGSLAGVDGVEWLNLDSEWRDDSAARLLGTALRSLIRAPEAIVSLASRPPRTLRRWDLAASVRPVFAVAALDAHARAALADQTASRGGFALPLPSYDAMFRTVNQSVLLEAPLSGTDARADATRLVQALTAGRSFSVVRAFAAPALLEFAAERGSARTGTGGTLPDGPDPVVFHAAVAAAPSAQLVLVGNGRPVASGRGSLTYRAPRPEGVYRVEAMWPGEGLPWIVSNAITVGSRGEPETEVPDAGVTRTLVPVPLDPARWRVERDPSSSGGARLDAGALRFDFDIAAGAAHGQYAALSTDVGGIRGSDRVQFVGRSARPMRVSLQVRLPDGRGGQRWRRSVYLDETPRSISVSLDEFEPAGASTSRRPVVAPVLSLLVVVDTLNTLPGTTGTVWLSDLALAERPAAP